MKNKNKLNNKNERNFMTTNSKCRILLCLVLPLTFAAGCASNPANSYFNHAPAPIMASASRQQAANQVIGIEIYEAYLTDTNFAYTMVASINKGVVTLQGPISYGGEQKPDRMERQGIDNRIWNMDGVNQVKDELNIDTV